MIRPRPAIALGLLLSGLAVATTVLAQPDLTTRRIGVTWRDGVPHLSFSARDLANESVRRELASGLQKRLVTTIQAYAADRSSPVATQVFSCAVTYDLWEESYVVRLGHTTERHADLASVLSRCLVLSNAPLGRAERWTSVQGREVYFAVRAEFNPISHARCRALLRPTASDGPVGPVVINIVRREICSAERAIDFRSPVERVP